MKSFGIYTLGNDVVYDQIVALVNSIERNVGKTIPICIIPFDDNSRKIRQFIASRPQLSLYDNAASIARWENFATTVWAAHPQSQAISQSGLTHQVPKWFKQCQLLRKMCAFDGDFEQFVFYDADSLAMQPLGRVIEQLQTHHFVFDDWEHQKPTAAAALKFGPIGNTLGLSEAEIRPQIHCSSFFGGHRDYFTPKRLRELQHKLVNQQEIAWINDLAFWCDADLFSYITLRMESPIYNFTLSGNGQDRTGNTAEAAYANIDQVLYNSEGLKPIHRLHYITHPAESFTRLCQGEAVALPYQDLFLFYRFLHEPERRPQSFRSPNWAMTQTRSIRRKVKKLQQRVA
jgi:hypothetical protein